MATRAWGWGGSGSGRDQSARAGRSREFRGYLLGEVGKSDTFKDPIMLQRMQELNALSDQDRDHILYALDGLLRDAKARTAYA